MRYRDGATVCELAERFSIHRTTVSGHLHHRGIKMRGHSLDERQAGVAIKLYEQGWSTLGSGGTWASTAAASGWQFAHEECGCEMPRGGRDRSLADVGNKRLVRRYGEACGR
jgi:hypothetical protein